MCKKYYEKLLCSIVGSFVGEGVTGGRGQCIIPEVDKNSSKMPDPRTFSAEVWSQVCTS